MTTGWVVTAGRRGVAGGCGSLGVCSWNCILSPGLLPFSPLPSCQELSVSLCDALTHLRVRAMESVTTDWTIEITRQTKLSLLQVVLVRCFGHSNENLTNIRSFWDAVMCASAEQICAKEDPSGCCMWASHCCESEPGELKSQCHRLYQILAHLPTLDGCAELHREHIFAHKCWQRSPQFYTIIFPGPLRNRPITTGQGGVKPHETSAYCPARENTCAPAMFWFQDGCFCKLHIWTSTL